MAGRVGKFGENRSVDVFPLCGLFSLEIICAVGFNKDLRDDMDNIALTLLQVMDESAKLLPIDAALPFLKRYNIGQHLPGPVGNVFRSFYKWMDLTKELLKEFRQSQLRDDTSQRFMATPLLMDEDHYLGRRLTDDEAIEEAMGLAFAGSGTTSTTLLYILYHMSRPENQHHQEKLRAELLSNGESINELQQLPYLNAVIKEVMRLNPTIISTLPRILDVDLLVGKAGVTLPKGTVVGMQNYVHHRDPTAFPQPESFQPTRWLGECEMAEKSFTPFSLGPRNCIGQNLARAELYLATSKIFRALSVSLSPSMQESDMEMEDRFNISPRGRKLLLDVVPIN
jgi:cytochrome P450